MAKWLRWSRSVEMRCIKGLDLIITSQCASNSDAIELNARLRLVMVFNPNAVTTSNCTLACPKNLREPQILRAGAHVHACPKNEVLAVARTCPLALRILRASQGGFGMPWGRS